MTLKTKRVRIENLLEELADDTETARQSINIAVDFLMVDTYWLKGTISPTDRENLFKLVKELGHE